MVGANPRYQSKHQRLAEARVQQLMNLAEPRPPLPQLRPQPAAQMVRVGGRIIGEVRVIQPGLTKAFTYSGGVPQWLGTYISAESAAAALAAAWTREQVGRREQ